MASQLTALIQKMKGKKILVIGDMIADIYLSGRIARISREAPVLVLEQENELVVPGGAANVVHNIMTLGGQAYVVGVVGDDKQGGLLQERLLELGADLRGLVRAVDRLTISKTRIIAGGEATVSQQIVRIDRETKEFLSSRIEMELEAGLSRLLKEVDGVVMSDYGSHTITKSFIQRILTYCGQNQIPSIVDARYDLELYAGVQYVKQNEAEAARVVGFPLCGEDRLLQAGASLLEKMRAEGILLTRGANGMMLFKAGQEPVSIPVTNKSEVFDVSGAGDTAVAAMILALCAKAPAHLAAQLANYASGIAVKKQGTAAVSAMELMQAIGGTQC